MSNQQIYPVPNFAVGDHFECMGVDHIITAIIGKEVFYEKTEGPLSGVKYMLHKDIIRLGFTFGCFRNFRKETALEKAARLIDEYCRHEFGGQPADFGNLRKIPVAYTTTEDEAELPIQVYVDLEGFTVERYILDVLVETRQYESIEALIEWELDGMTFDDLTWVTEEQMDFALAKVNKEI